MNKENEDLEMLLFMDRLLQINGKFEYKCDPSKSIISK